MSKQKFTIHPLGQQPEAFHSVRDAVLVTGVAPHEVERNSSLSRLLVVGRHLEKVAEEKVSLSYDSLDLYFYRHDLIDLAKTILETFDPHHKP